MPPTLLPRPLAALVAAAAIAVPIAGCGGSGSSSAGGGSGDPAAALPASAPIYLEARVRPDGELAANVQAVGRKLLGGKDPGQELVRLLDRHLHDDGASFERDIAPWLGERAGIAVLTIRPGRSRASGASDGDAVAAIDSKDDTKAQAFLDREKGTVERSYQGVSYKFRAKGDEAAAVVDGRVLVGSERGLKAAIDATKGNALSESKAFQDARDAVPQDGLGFVYVDVQHVLDASSGALSSGSARNAQGVAAIKGLLSAIGLHGIASSVQVRGDAVLSDTALLGLKPQPQHGDGPGAAAAVPAGAWLSVGIGDVGGTVQRALAQLGSGASAGVDPAAILGQLKTSLGLDVQRDLLSWMGDAALFVEGTTPGDLRGALVVHSKDPAATQRAIAKLRALLPRLGMTSGAVRGLPGGATGLRFDAAGVPGGVQIAAKGDRFAIAIGRGALIDALGTSTPLGSTKAYKQAAGLLQGAKPSLFLDTPKAVRLAGAFAHDNKGFRRAKPTLEALGPAAAGSATEDGVMHVKAAVAVP